VKFFAVSLWLNMKKFALQRTLWFTITGLVVALFFAGVIATRADTPIVSVTAGVFYDQNCPVETEIFHTLVESVRDMPLINFVAYDDKAALMDDVRMGRLESGYVINPGIRDAKSGDFNELITLVVSPRSVFAPILNEIVAAAVFRAMSEGLATYWLESNFHGDEEIAEFVAFQFEWYRQSDIFMLPMFDGGGHGAEESQASVSDMTTRRVVHGLIGIAILIVAMFYIPILVDERRNGLNRALHVCGKILPYDASLFGAAFIAMLVVGTAGTIVVAAFMPFSAGAITALPAYVAVCAAVVAAASRWQKSAAIVQSTGIMIVILNILFGGVLLDLHEISPYLGRLQFLFPLFWYVQGVL